ncbi:MAG: L-serine ammonia-lyase, iron-sulfur-dependent, subunit alpha [Pseudobutyrivibrio sp.]|nr:L-serine ammonia-lyase, iron-sulfur-dependent, subunit alpha [Pseudobutyrivibrio sp.]
MDKSDSKYSSYLEILDRELVPAMCCTEPIAIAYAAAKASCEAKIAMAVEAGIMGFEMYEEGSEFLDGDGIVSKGVENTINNVSYLGHYGMKDTDEKIIEIMSKCYS